MKIASFSAGGRDRKGFVLSTGTLVDIREAVSCIGEDDVWQSEPADILAMIERRAEFASLLLNAHEFAETKKEKLREYTPDEVAWLPPIRRPSKIICVALNNRALDAAKIRGPSDHPAFFLKPSTSLIGHNVPIRLRPDYGLTHPEPELAVVISKELTRAPAKAIPEGIFGYTIMNDVTSVRMRDEDSFTFRYYRPDPKSGDLSEFNAHTSYAGRYKGSDTFGPCGPYIVTPDDVPDPHDLEIVCTIADQTIARDNTKNYVWSVPEAISHISRNVTLLPGDIISMGTATAASDAPSGSSPPPVFKADLQQTDGPVSVSISRIGTLTNPVEKIP